MFIGRKKELDTLKEAFSSDRQENILIYGRRRVGKTELIKEAIKDRNALYYEGKEISEDKVIDELSLLISEYLDLPKYRFDDIGSLLDLVFKSASDKPMILILDEYTYIQRFIKGIDSIIQSLIDKYNKTSKLKLILCGSYIDTMKELVAYGKPLYGRFRYVIDLKQMDYYDSSLFYEERTDEEKVAFYSIFGGIPFYNALIDKDLSFEDNIIKLVLNTNSVLYNEIEVYLKGELSKLENANGVMDAVAVGKSKFTDILVKTKISSSSKLSDVLNKLISMELIRKEAPINDPDNKKKIKYSIADNYTLFYYRYIYLNRSRLVVMNEKAFLDKYIKDDLYERYIPKVFESVCKQYLIRKNKANDLLDSFDIIGKYYYDDPKTKTNGEFDIVTESDDGYIFYECKYKDSQMTKGQVLKEIEQVNITGLACFKYGFFSKSGFKDIDLDNVILYTLSDLYRG